MLCQMHYAVEQCCLKPCNAAQFWRLLYSTVELVMLCRNADEKGRSLSNVIPIAAELNQQNFAFCHETFTSGCSGVTHSRSRHQKSCTIEIQHIIKLYQEGNHRSMITSPVHILASQSSTYNGMSKCKQSLTHMLTAKMLCCAQAVIVSCTHVCVRPGARIIRGVSRNK